MNAHKKGRGFAKMRKLSIILTDFHRKINCLLSFPKDNIILKSKTKLKEQKRFVSSHS